MHINKTLLFITEVFTTAVDCAGVCSCCVCLDAMHGSSFLVILVDIKAETWEILQVRLSHVPYVYMVIFTRIKLLPQLLECHEAVACSICTVYGYFYPQKAAALIIVGVP